MVHARVAVLIGCVAVSVFCAAYPMYVIRPFRAQGVGELDLALLVMRVRPVVTILCALVALAEVVVGRWRLGAVVALLLTGAGAVASRINIFERMFHPLDTVASVGAAEAKQDADDMVLSVVVNGAARGYPVRAIAYHHVVNDLVGGVPIVGTY